MAEATSRPVKLPEAEYAAAWLSEAALQLGRYEQLINGINVFPVRDQDTGSNLRVTMAAAASAVAQGSDCSGRTWGEILGHAARAAGAAALGNSGTVVVILLSTLAERLGQDRRLDSIAWSQAVSAADVRASSAISDLAPASIFDALGAAARCPAQPDAGLTGLLDLVEDQTARAAEAVAATMSATETLEKFGVVDAGAVGLLVLLESLRSVLWHEPFRDELIASLPGTHAPLAPSDDSAEEAVGVEIVCTVDATPLDAALLRAELDGVGESVIMTPLTPSHQPDETSPWRIHVHVEDEEHGWSAIRSIGEPRDVQVTSLACKSSSPTGSCA